MPWGAGSGSSILSLDGGGASTTWEGFWSTGTRKAAIVSTSTAPNASAQPHVALWVAAIAGTVQFEVVESSRPFITIDVKSSGTATSPSASTEVMTFSKSLNSMRQAAHCVR
jgi:hypothetical protein